MFWGPGVRSSFRGIAGKLFKEEIIRSSPRKSARRVRIRGSSEMASDDKEDVDDCTVCLLNVHWNGAELAASVGELAWREIARYRVGVRRNHRERKGHSEETARRYQHAGSIKGHLLTGYAEDLFIPPPTF
ncbi:unnamed protein product [Heligmosomoides polygyrus]|uniref:Uncharacterized protein n=1 Tax=Heligmosomoides polygyrus TaxID=6339 RepID=A0A183GN83_HELPZ|nr:unnamed protein product [Heligmosomoides polygyrus]